MTVSDIVQFWLGAGPKAWFAKTEAFDEAIRHRFEATHHAAARRELDGWNKDAEGALALMLLLDQFPRNLYRGSAHAFAADPLARLHARAAVAAGHDQASAPAMRVFFYLPFEHSEDPADQARSIQLFETHAAMAGDQDSLRWAKLHADIIVRFGRFPHRNAALARQSTPEEIKFLKDGGFAG